MGTGRPHILLLSLVISLAALAACEPRKPEVHRSPVLSYDAAVAPLVVGQTQGSREMLSGIGIRPVVADKGVGVGMVYPGGPADQAGLKVGDVMVAIDGQSSATWTPEHAARAIRGDPGTTVRLDCLRGDKPMTFVVTRRVMSAPQSPNR